MVKGAHLDLGHPMFESHLGWGEGGGGVLCYCEKEET